MLVEAAWVAAKTPGPLRAFFVRVRGRRGRQIAAVATARKLAVLAWHLLTKQQDYAWARPSLTEKKRRALELRAGQPAERGQRGRAHASRPSHTGLDSVPVSVLCSFMGGVSFRRAFQRPGSFGHEPEGYTAFTRLVG